MRRMYSQKEIEQLALAKAQELIESGEVENAKPIYYHPVILDRPSPNFVRVSFWILNNNPTAFTKSTFAEFISTLSDSAIRLNCTGSVLNDGSVLIVSDVRTIDSTHHNLVGLYASTGAYDAVSIESILEDNATLIADSPNKIN